MYGGKGDQSCRSLLRDDSVGVKSTLPVTEVSVRISIRSNSRAICQRATNRQRRHSSEMMSRDKKPLSPHLPSPHSYPIQPLKTTLFPPFSSLKRGRRCFARLRLFAGIVNGGGLYGTPTAPDVGLRPFPPTANPQPLKTSRG